MAPSVTLLLNRPEAPGSFTVQAPIALSDTIVATQVMTAQQQSGFGLRISDFNDDGRPDVIVGANLSTNKFGAWSLTSGPTPGVLTEPAS